MNAELTDKPVILVVDDEADKLRSGLQLALGAEAELTVRHPQSVEPEDLGTAHLVLIDYLLEDWPERETRSAAANIRTGLALAAVLREAANEGSNGRHLTAVALHTAHLSDASGRIRSPYSKHVVARLNNLEWVFEKSDPDYRGVVQLARAAQRLELDWPDDSSASERLAREFLSLDDKHDWADRAWREVRECQPPVYEL